MNEQNLGKSLHSIADAAIDEKKDAYPGLKKYIQQHMQTGGKNRPANHRRAWQWVGGIALAVLLSITVFAFTPQGRVLAQRVLRFFTYSTGDQRPANSSQTAVKTTSETSSQAAAISASDDSTPDPASILDSNLEIREVLLKAGYQIYVPSWIPENLQFSGASIEENTNIARIFFLLSQRELNSNGLVFRQEPLPATDDCTLCDQVGADGAIQQVSIAGIYGEYVKGVWKYTDKGPVWESDPYLQRMRWQDKGMAFELLFMGPPDSMNLENMTRIAESLKEASSPLPDEAIWNLTLQEAEELSGFTVNLPASLPQGYNLDDVIYNPSSNDLIQMYKFHPYSAGEQFNIHQSRRPFVDEIGNSAGVELLTIDGKTVEYVHGSWFGPDGSPVETWQPNSIFHTFRWQDGDDYFALEVLFDETDTWSPAYWTRDGMMGLIELVMGARSDFPDQVNYNNITDISTAGQLAGFHVLQPQTLPEGLAFERAVYDPTRRSITLLYGVGTDSRTDGNAYLVIIEEPAEGAIDYDLAGYPQSAIEQVEVSGYRATLARGAVIDGQYQDVPRWTLIGNREDLRVILWIAPDDPHTILGKNEFLLIAESLQ